MIASHPEPPRDWDAELRAIDRELDRSPGSAVPSPGSSAGPVPRRDITGVQRLGTWTRVVLGLLVGIGMTQWPYTHGCGWRFILYLTAILGVLTAGVWSSLSSWKRRLGVAHVLSQLLIIWGLVLGARGILPRVGYARVAAPWLCPDLPLAGGKTAARPVSRLATTVVATIAGRLLGAETRVVGSERTCGG